jgi:hypothetical protein
MAGEKEGPEPTWSPISNMSQMKERYPCGGEIEGK